MNYNQPRSPRTGNIIKCFDFNYEGWLRVRVVSKHKKTSKYAGSVNCTYLNINWEPDGLYFYFGDFRLILQEDGDDPEGQINYFFEILDKLITWKEQNLAKFTILAKFSKVKSTIFHPSWLICPIITFVLQKIETGWLFLLILSCSLKTESILSWME